MAQCLLPGRDGEPQETQEDYRRKVAAAKEAVSGAMRLGSSRVFTSAERVQIARLAADIRAAYQVGTHRQNVKYTDTFGSEDKDLIVRALEAASRGHN